MTRRADHLRAMDRSYQARARAHKSRAVIRSVSVRALAKLPLAPWLAVVLFLLTGCGTLDYLAQAANGQKDFMDRAQDIDMLVANRHLEPKRRALLGQVRIIKAFGERHGLVPTKNYEKYVRLDRPEAVWVVSASEPLRFRSKVWSFPIIGAITYVGWFDAKEARRAGAGLAEAGWDVDVRPAGAYSTLGWFADPVLSSMIPEGKEAAGALAEIILHESLHATFYVNGQSRLNESVASFVGRRLAIVYLTETVGADSGEMRAYVDGEAAGERRRDKFRAGYDELERVYASKLPDADKLAEKRRIIEALRPYGRASRPINNAMLIQYKTYNSGMKEQEALLAACGGSYPRYIRALEPLKAMRFPVQYPEVGEMIARLGNRCGP